MVSIYNKDEESFLSNFFLNVAIRIGSINQVVALATLFFFINSSSIPPSNMLIVILFPLLFRAFRWPF